MINNLPIALPHQEDKLELVEDYISKLEQTHNQLSALIKSLPKGAFTWQPILTTQNIGMLLLHIAYTEAYWLGEVISEEAKAYLWDDTKPKTILSVPENHSEWYLDLINTVRYHTIKKIKQLSTSSYVHLSNGEGKESYPISWVLWHLMEHETHHRGQIALLKNWYQQTYTPIYA